MQRRFLSEGRRVWYLGHWGLQYYLAQKGADQIDEAAGAEAIRRGTFCSSPRSIPTTPAWGARRWKKTIA